MVLCFSLFFAFFSHTHKVAIRSCRFLRQRRETNGVEYSMAWMPVLVCLIALECIVFCVCVVSRVGLVADRYAFVFGVIAPIMNIDELMKHPHAQARHLYANDTSGFPMPASAPRFSRTPGSIVIPSSLTETN